MGLKPEPHTDSTVRAQPLDRGQRPCKGNDPVYNCFLEWIGHALTQWRNGGLPRLSLCAGLGAGPDQSCRPQLGDLGSDRCQRGSAPDRTSTPRNGANGPDPRSGGWRWHCPRRDDRASGRGRAHGEAGEKGRHRGWPIRAPAHRNACRRWFDGTQFSSGNSCPMTPAPDPQAGPDHKDREAAAPREKRPACRSAPSGRPVAIQLR